MMGNHVKKAPLDGNPFQDAFVFYACIIHQQMLFVNPNFEF